MWNGHTGNEGAGLNWGDFPMDHQPTNIVALMSFACFIFRSFFLGLQVRCPAPTSASWPTAKLKGSHSVCFMFANTEEECKLCARFVIWQGDKMRHSPCFFSSFLCLCLCCREPVGLSVFSDEETDLIRELQTMCSSKSEPDISKVSDVITVFSAWSPSEEN